MQSDNRFFEDFTKVLNGAAGTLAGMGREGEAAFKTRMRDWMGGEDAVSRDEFEAVKEMAANARSEVDALKVRLDALDGRSTAAGEAPLKPGATGPLGG